MTNASPWLIIRLVAALLLGTIGLQALANDAGALDEHRQGSAFSSATVDVALLTSPRELAIQSLALPQPNLAPPVQHARPTDRKIATDEGSHLRHADPVGHAGGNSLALQLAPRPPPIS